MRHNRFNISTGVVEVIYPSTMTVDDVQDFRDAMAVTFRILERTATNDQPIMAATSEHNLADLPAQAQATGPAHALLPQDGKVE